ncbi:phosphate/phosphite/phosphonate ABC transporter substrate-binding protein [Variovorax paradoxus]|nr:phosphate/phosphite/phosphonate ABC transporter substrate-binding protein [Variovorax paradoxus]
MPSRWPSCATVHPEGSARRCVLRAAWRCSVAAALGLHAAAALAQGLRGELPPALRFGVLPIGGAVESRENWTVLLNDLSRALGRPVSVLSVSSYESLEQAIGRNEVDFALLSAKLALDAVSQRRMNVLAQVTRHEGAPDHRAVLLTRTAPPFNTLQELLARPERWRLARGDSRSVSGFMVPQLELFLPHGIAMETRFKSEIVDTHQATALAVANGDADVATNNTTDFERFRRQFPAEAARLQVIWESKPTPPALFVVRSDHPPALQKKLQAFLVGYGRGKGPGADAEREVLKSLHASLGYAAADNSALLPAAALEYQLARQRALNAKWVSPEARAGRLERIERSHAEQVRMLHGFR